ncbi:class I adenylate-forming enzyme family protein [Marinibaculum pumilum]|uniref:Class I adenylate-forming enzyme family protein n=1 Tax=Marinibaculum pumilum TaxID=1766165 RepID=A0ABV7L072_9PROT
MDKRTGRSMRLLDYFRRALDFGRDRPAFVDEGGTVSYGEVDRRSARIAAGLQALDLPEAPKVAVLSPNGATAFVAVLAIVRSGAIWVPANVRNPAQVNGAFLAAADCCCLFYDVSLADEVAAVLATAPGIRHAVCLDGSAMPGHLSLDALIALSDAEPAEPPDDPDALVMIAPTGGTTGLPKAAMITNRMWESMIAAAWACMPPRGRIAFLVAGPMTHGAGVVALMMMAGAPAFVILRKPDPMGVMTAIERHRITHLYLPPTMVNMITEHPDVGRFDFGSLEHLVIAASPIAPDKLRRAVEVFGDAVCQSFGQAEAPMFLTFLSNRDLRQADPEAPVDRFGSCGRATLGVRVEVMDEAGAILPPGRKGEIVARGSLVFPGYYRNPQATAEVSAHGWHHTGDVGFKDEEGFLYIVDRKKDMIVTGGFNVFSVEVEAAILAHPAVRECAVIGVPDAKWGEAIKAVVELKAGETASEPELQSLVRQRLGGVHTPKSVEFWPELPRSTNGKIWKSEVRAHFWRGQDRSIA